MLRPSGTEITQTTSVFTLPTLTLSNARATEQKVPKRPFWQWYVIKSNENCKIGWKKILVVTHCMSVSTEQAGLPGELCWSAPGERQSDSLQAPEDTV